MRRTLLVLLALALAALVVFLLRREAPHIAPPVERAPAAEAPSRVESTLADVVTPDAPRAASVAEPVPTQAPVAAGESDARAEDGLAEIRGRFLAPNGSPAAGVAVAIRGWTANNERVMKYGEPTAWEDPRTSSGPDGRFVLRFDPPRAYQFVLEGELAGHPKVGWRWGEIEPARRIDLGDVMLALSGSVRARVVDGQGRVLDKGWTIYADGGMRDPATKRESTSVRAAVDASGWALLEGLPPGPAQIKAYSRIANWVDGPVTQVRVGEVVDVDVAYSGPDNSRRIVVIPFVRHFFVFSGQIESITLTGAAIEPRVAKKVERSSQSFSFEDLEPGRYSVQIDDPRFLPWRSDGVEPGTSLDAKLKGSAAVSLSVVDAATGTRIERYEVDVRFDGAQFGPNVFRVLERKDEPPAGGLFDGLVPFDQTLIVRADGYAPCEVAAPALAANETRALTARLSRGATLSGFVRERGTPTVYPDVEVVLRAQETTKGNFRSRSADDSTARSARTDSAGRFAFEQVGDGSWTVSVRISPVLNAQRELVVAGDSAPDATIEVAPSGVIVGRLIGPPSASWDGMRISALPRKPDDVAIEDWSQAWMRFEDAAVIAADGTFRTPPLPVGVVDLALRMPDARIPTGLNGWMGSEGGRIVLEVVALERGENKREYDVRDRFPGSIDVAARVDGEPASMLVVQAISTSEDGATGVATLDVGGKGALRPLVPGTYRIVAHPIDGSWRHQYEGTVAVVASGSASVAIDVQLAQGTLLAVDATTGAPLASRQVQLGFAGTQWPEIQLQSDAEGRVRAKLPLGRYEAWTWTDGVGFARGPSIEWTTRGPTPERVAITVR